MFLLVLLLSKKQRIFQPENGKQRAIAHEDYSKRVPIQEHNPFRK
jgi:hypothetical protein